mgnify:CR=1 FL=1
MEQQIHFDNHLGERLTGTLHEPERPSVGAVVAGHCFTCSRHTGIIRRICNDLSHAAFTVLRFDFSGNGQSQGQFEQSTWSKQIREMETAVALVKEQGADWIGLAGHSLGAAIALLTAERLDSIAAVCRVAGRVSQARPMYFLSPPQQQILAETGQVGFTSRGRQLRLNRDFFDDAGQYDLTAATRSLTIPMLVVHGDQVDYSRVRGLSGQKGQPGNGAVADHRRRRSHVFPARSPATGQPGGRRLVLPPGRCSRSRRSR